MPDACRGSTGSAHYCKLIGLFSGGDSDCEVCGLQLAPAACAGFWAGDSRFLVLPVHIPDNPRQFSARCHYSKY